MEKKTTGQTDNRTVAISQIIETMNKAGHLTAGAAMVVYSDQGRNQTGALVSAAAKVLSESPDIETDLDGFRKLVYCFKDNPE